MKKTCSLSLDLDNLWSYLKVHGDSDWDSFPSYLDLFVPRLLEFLDRHDLRITVFIVGQDAAIEANRPHLRAIAEAGHEIANHSFKHEPWLHLYTADQLGTELEQAEIAIREATGVLPRGFRGPGFSISNDTLTVLKERGYAYDASTLPTFIGPLARMYYFLTANMSKDDREDRKALFGSVRDGFRSNSAYQWNTAAGELLEIPVTTIPIFKVPFHFSYLFYIAQVSPWIAKTYLRFALFMCRITRTEPSILLHPLDFLSEEDVPELGFFPAMGLGAERKLALLADMIQIIRKRYEIRPMGEHAQQILTRSNLRAVEPRFST